MLVQCISKIGYKVLQQHLLVNYNSIFRLIWLALLLVVRPDQVTHANTCNIVSICYSLVLRLHSQLANVRMLVCTIAQSLSASQHIAYLYIYM
jgi:hypothetical protein